MKTPEQIDLFVVGSGVAATTVAYQCRAAGWTVALADDRPFGGTCANRGCDPKRVLAGGAEIVDSARRMQPNGVHADHLGIDWPALMRFKRSFTDPVPANREAEFQKEGITAFHGFARFESEDRIACGDRVFAPKYVLIASGTGAARLNIPGEDLLINSDQFLDLEAIPASIAFIGGGYIAFEFAHIAARAGAKVTILHRGRRALEQFDADLVDRLVQQTRRIGIDVRLNAAAQRVERVDGGFRVSTGDGEVTNAALVVHAAGRTPLLDHLQPEAANVARTPRGVVVNQFLQSTTNPRVFAAGDVADSGAPKLTPVAGYHGQIVAANLLKGTQRTANYVGCASTVFTEPPLASVGLTEEEARKQGLRITVHQAETTSWYASRRVAEECSAFKVILDQDTDRILGAHILGQGAEEMINLFALAMRSNLTAAALRENLFAYPTHSSNVGYML